MGWYSASKARGAGTLVWSVYLRIDERHSPDETTGIVRSLWLRPTSRKYRTVGCSVPHIDSFGVLADGQRPINHSPTVPIADIIAAPPSAQPNPSILR